MKTRRLIVAILAFLLLTVAAAVGDTPLPNPSPVHVCSHNFCVDSHPDGDTVFRCRGNQKSDRCHWSIPGWHRNVFVSDCGLVAVVYGGGHLLPLNYDPDTVLIQLWKNGLMVRAIRARDISGIQQRRTASHYLWGVVRGFDTNDQIIVTTDSGRRIPIADEPQPFYNYFPAALVDEFRAQWYGSYLNAYGEPSLWERSKNSRAQIYRFTWLRTFHHPVVVRVEVRRDGLCELTAKVGLGSGGYDPGMLIRNDTRILSENESATFLNQAFSNLWKEAHEETEPRGTDGSQWILEGVKDGHYRIEDRWSPDDGPIRELGLALIELAGLEIPKDEIY